MKATLISNIAERLGAHFEQACNDWITDNYDLPENCEQPLYGEESYWDEKAEEAVIEDILLRIFGED